MNEELFTKLIDKVIEHIKQDIRDGDVSAVDVLLRFCPIKTLIGYLPEEIWGQFVSEQNEKINHIKKVLNTWGITTSSELELSSSPVYNNLTGKICTLVENFNLDGVGVVTYDDDIDIYEYDIPYEDLSDDLIDEIYEIIDQYDVAQNKLYDSIRDEDY
jgi:hypothetical protein